MNMLVAMVKSNDPNKMIEATGRIRKLLSIGPPSLPSFLFTLFAQSYSFEFYLEFCELGLLDPYFEDSLISTSPSLYLA